MLSFLIFFPLISALAMLLARSHAKQVAFIAALLEFVATIWVLGNFRASGGLQLEENYWWVNTLGISYHVGVDGISLLLVLLTNFLVPLIILSSFGQSYKKPGLFYFLILVMQMALVGVFVARDGFLFYVFWELALIPIYLICLVWGGKNSARITLRFFIYTLFGSLLMLVALIWLYLQTPAPHSFDLKELYGLHLTMAQQSWIFWALFLAFAIKMPVFPFHSWQPDTYTDAPTPGTMLLSGIMLKMGIYGVIRWLLPIVPGALPAWGPVAIALSVIGIVYASLIAFAQKDFKRLLAYSSIAHVGLISAGIFSLTIQGIQGGVIQMISHGVNVVALFFIAEILFRRAQTNNMDNLGGIRTVAPAFATLFMIFLLASIALPLTNGFIGEFLLLNGLFQISHVWAAIGGLTIIFGAVYMLRAYQKIALGEGNPRTLTFRDLSFSEKTVLIPLLLVVFWIGIYPKPLLDLVEPSVITLRDTILGVSSMVSR